MWSCENKIHNLISYSEIGIVFISLKFNQDLNKDFVKNVYVLQIRWKKVTKITYLITKATKVHFGNSKVFRKLCCKFNMTGKQIFASENLSDEMQFFFYIYM